MKKFVFAALLLAVFASAPAFASKRPHVHHRVIHHHVRHHNIHH